MALPGPVAALAARPALLGGVEAVALGGSRATRMARPDSDWDLGVYYRGTFDPDALRALGHEGHVSAVGEWGPIVNGGAWLTVDDIPVDVLYRDLAQIEAWAAHAQDGRFAVFAQNGYLAGAPTYLPAGELAIGVTLHGALPRPGAVAASAVLNEKRLAARAGLHDALAPGASVADVAAALGIEPLPIR